MATDFDAKYGAPVKSASTAINFDDKYGPAVDSTPADSGTGVALASIPRPASLPALTKSPAGVLKGKPSPLVQPEDTDPRAALSTAIGAKMSGDVPSFLKSAVTPQLVPLGKQLMDEGGRFAQAVKSGTDPEAATSVPDFLGKATKTVAGAAGIDTSKLAEAARNKDIPSMISEGAVPLAENYALGKVAGLKSGVSASELAADNASLARRALRPRDANLQFAKSTERAAPAIQEELAQRENPPATLEDWNDVFKTVKNRVWNQYKELLSKGAQAPGNPEDYLYHGTGKEGAAQIDATGKLGGPGKSIWLTDNPETAQAYSQIRNMDGSGKVFRVKKTDIDPDILAGAKTERPGEYNIGQHMKYEVPVDTGGATIDGNKIADAIASSIDKRSALKSPTTAKAITDFADTYRRPLAPQEAEQFLEYANRESQPYFQLASKDPHQAPWMQANVAEGNALRKELYSKLDQIDPGAAAKLKQTYGGLTSMHDYLQKRLPVVERQNTVNLQQSINRPFAAATYAAGHPLAGALQFVLSEAQKRANDPVNQLNQAFLPQGPGLVNGTVMPGVIGATARPQGSPVTLDMLKKAATAVTQ